MHTPIRTVPANDADKRRIAKVVDSATTKYFLDGSDVIADYDACSEPVEGGSDVLQATYVTPGLDQNLSQERGGSTYYYMRDGLGSIRNLLDASEDAVNTYDYYAFGKELGSWTQNLTNRYTYTAREWDEESAQYYYRARYYDGGGRFACRDPIGYEGGLNLYLYVSSRPAMGRDPFGKDMITVGTRKLQGKAHVLPYHHMSMEYWEGPCPSSPAVMFSLWSDSIVHTGMLRVDGGNRKKDSIELLVDNDYWRWEKKPLWEHVDTSPQVHQTGWTWDWSKERVSRISVGTSRATLQHVLEIGGKGELLPLWRYYRGRGLDYRYALRPEEKDIPDGMWPNVKYELPRPMGSTNAGNNSNTFIRWLVGGGYDWPGMETHPGAMMPGPASDTGFKPIRAGAPRPPRPADIRW